MKGEQLQKEQVERKALFATLEGLSGFQKLSRKQQQMIQMSLYANDRFKRKDESPSTYLESVAHCYAWNCHSAAWYLEHELPFESVPWRQDMDAYTEGTYLESGNHPSYEAVAAHIESGGYPSIGIIHRDGRAIHSFVALGKDARGDVMVWEKEGYAFPYRLLPLRQVYNEHFEPNAVIPYSWGVRPFHISS